MKITDFFQNQNNSILQRGTSNCIARESGTPVRSADFAPSHIKGERQPKGVLVNQNKHESQPDSKWTEEGAWRASWDTQ